MKGPDLRSLLLIAAAAVILAVAALQSQRNDRAENIPALATEPNPWPADTFQASAVLAWPEMTVPGLQPRGSRVADSGDYRGEFVSGWFEARPVVGLLVAGFPNAPGNKLALEFRDEQGTLLARPFDRVNPRECWQPWTVTLPPGTASFRVRATDGEGGHNGWLAATDPFVPSFRPVFLSQVARTYLAFAVQAVLLLALGYAAARVLSRQEWISPALLPLIAGAVVASLGYAAFWIYFAHPLAGRIFSWGIGLAGCVLPFLARRNEPSRDPTQGHAVILGVVIGIFYLSLLMLYEPTRFSYTAANRFQEGLPSDNEIPRAFADRLWHGHSPRDLWGDWLSSDRPPLQVGWQLLTSPVMHALGFDPDVVGNVAGVCFQLLWVLALWALVRHFGASARQALGVVAAVSFNGVLLEYSVFVWPKLSAAALMIGAYLLWSQVAEKHRRLGFALGGWCAALGWLSHGGVAFSILGLAPLVVAWRSRVRFHHWLLAAVVFVLAATPWIAYQKLYDPPGNRLLKWHLGGEMGVDPRGALEAIRDGYQKAGLVTALRNKWANVEVQLHGRWPRAADFDFSLHSRSLREDEDDYLLRSWCGWILALLAPLLWLLRVRSGPPAPARRAMLDSFLWLVTGIVAWLLLLFRPYTAVIHQGTLVSQLLPLALLATSALYLHRWFFAVLSTLQAIWFVVAWVPPSRVADGRVQTAAVALAVLAGLVLLAHAWRAAVREAAGVASDPRISGSIP